MAAQRIALRIGTSLDSADGKRSFCTTLFDALAPTYDFITVALSFGRDQSWKRGLVASLPPIARPTCVDLACGTGDVTRLLARRYRDGQVTGVDLSAAMLARASVRAACDRVSFLQHDMQSLPLPAASVDLLTGAYALRNAPDLDATLAEVTRVLRPGGVAAFLDFSKPTGRRAQRVEHLLLRTWTELWGRLMHGNADTYGYIAASLAAFPDRRQLHSRLSRHGLQVLARRRHFFGIVERVVTRKSPEHSALAATRR